MITENKKLITFSHTMSMNKDWQQSFIDKLGAKIINERQMKLPEAIASGSSYFMEIIPGLFVLIADFTFHVNIEFTKVESAGDFCIAYYDISDQISIHKVNNSKHKVGYHSKLGMGIVDDSLQSIYTPPVSERMYSFRLLISKDLLKEHLGSIIPPSLAKKTFASNKNTIFFYGHIESDTRVLLLKLKSRSYDQASFELHLRGVALNAFNSLISRMSEKKLVIGKLSEINLSVVMKTQLYLMENLLEKFPGVNFLAKMAGLSETKYNKLFNKLFKCSPNTFFLQEKFTLARVLLKSGDFSTICDVAYEIGYNKSGYFSGIYKKKFGRLPNSDFISSKNRI